MTELYSGLLDSVGQFVRSWLLPSSVAVALTAVALFPSVDSDGVLHDIAHSSTESQAIIAALVALLLAFLLAALQSILYRILEGYYLPSGWKANWTKKQFDEREA